MKRAHVALAVLMIVTLPGASHGRAASGPRNLTEDVARAFECSAVPTEAIVDHLVVDTTPVVPLDVLVFVDRRDIREARAVFRTAAKAFVRVGIDLNWRFRKTAVPDLGRETDPYLGWVKKQVGGVRPRRFDVVYLATSHVLYSNGEADCIGGVAKPENSFAVGMLSWHGVLGVRIVGYELPQGPPVADGGAKLVVHEIGHLLGGHHHYGPCGVWPEPGDPIHPCDVMNPVLVQQIGLYYGPVNAAIVRYHALKYLRR